MEKEGVGRSAEKCCPTLIEKGGEVKCGGSGPEFIVEPHVNKKARLCGRFEGSKGGKAGL